MLYPDGIKLERDFNPLRMTEKSLAALKERKPVFEAGFTFNQAYAIADILVPTENDGWDLIEVKSSTSVKPEHVIDAAFQRYTYQGIGIKLNRVFLMYLNKQYYRHGELEIDKLFAKEDVTERTDELIGDIPHNIKKMIKMITGPEPEIGLGEKCSDQCALWGMCTEFLPKDNIFTLRSGRKIALALLEKEIYSLTKIPSYVELNEKQQIQLTAYKNKKAFIDKPMIKDFLDQLKYPLYYIDFETMAPAIPIYEGTRPYMDIPFQYSLHVQEKPGGKLKHYSYIAPGDGDPRPAILERLKKELGDNGSIVAYNAKFEIKCLGSASEQYPEYKPWFEEIEKRFVDLLIPFKNFDYYHPKQMGSASLKYVLPALTGTDYSQLEIQDGRRASTEYLRVTYDPKVPDDEQKAVYAALEKYCGLDTLAMVKIIGVLQDSN